MAGRVDPEPADPDVGRAFGGGSDHVPAAAPLFTKLTRTAAVPHSVLSGFPAAARCPAGDVTFPSG